MKTFTVADQKRRPIKYEFVCCDGLLMEISSRGDYGNEQPLNKYYRRQYPKQRYLTENIFTEAFKAMLTDESFSDLTAFFKAIEKDELYLPFAKELLAQQINSLASRIQDMSLVLINL